MEVKRDDYLDEIKSVMGNGLVKVITGIRRCGKSYFLFKSSFSPLDEIGYEDLNLLKYSITVGMSDLKSDNSLE